MQLVIMVSLLVAIIGLVLHVVPVKRLGTVGLVMFAVGLFFCLSHVGARVVHF